MSFEVGIPIAMGIIAGALTLMSAWNWQGGKYLCDNCRFNNEDDCKKADRCCAVICFAYRKTG